MTATFVRALPAAGTLGNLNNSTLTQAFDATGCSALLVGVVVGNEGGNVTTTTVTATYNGVSMTALVPKTMANGSTTAGFALFGLISPTTGSNNVVVTTNLSASAANRLTVSIVGYSGVGEFGNVDFASDPNSLNGGPWTMDVGRGNVGAGFVCHGSPITSVDQTLRGAINNFSVTTALNCMALIESTGVGASTTFSANSADIDKWSVAAVELVSIYIVSDTEDINIGSGGNILLAEPASVAVGDLLLGILVEDAGIPGNISGFTSDVTATLGVRHSRITHRVADGTEGPTYTSAVASGTYSAGKMLRITGAVGGNPIRTTGSNSGSSTTTTFPSLTNLSSNTCLAVALVAGDEGATNSPAGWTFYDSLVSGVDEQVAIWTKAVASGAASGAATIGWDITADWVVSVVLIEQVPYIVTDDEDVNGSGGDISIPEPTGLAVGELLLAFLMSSQSASIPANITGFTSDRADTPGVGGYGIRTTHRVADGTEGPTYASTIAANNFSAGKMLRIVGENQTTPVPTTGQNSGTASSATFPSVLATVDCLAVTHLTCSAFAISGSPSGSYSVYELYSSSFQGIYYKPLLAGQSSGAETVALGGSSAYVATTVLVATAVVAAAAAAPVLRGAPIRSAVRLR